jgi:uncharacterized membrane protein YgcG
LRDIPVNAGDRISNIATYELVNEKQTSVVYTVDMEDSNFITVDIGDTSRKTGSTHTYRITYNYATTAKEGANLLSLNPVGFGWSAKIENVKVTLKLPKRFILGDMVVYVQKKGETDLYQQTYSIDGTTFTIKRKGSDEVTDYAFTYADNVLTMAYSGVLNGGSSTNEGITFDLPFESGVLTTSVNLVPYLFILGSLLLLVIIYLLRVFCFNKNKLTPVVNITAPNNLDPLMMGKLIDNKVNNEDITSLIYYWADKGYLKINLDNPDNPVLIRVMQTLPPNTPSYQVTMYNGLFRGGNTAVGSLKNKPNPTMSGLSGGSDVVAISSLKNRFYPVVEQVKLDVINRTKKLFDSKSIVVSILAMILSCLYLGMTPMLYAKFTIHSTLSMWSSNVVVVPGLIVYVLTEMVMYNRLKITKKRFWLYMAGLILLSVAFSAFYIVYMPAVIFPRIPLFIMSFLAFMSTILSISLITRTDAYTKQLNDIIGFRNFILYAEKDRLEAMLEEDPEFYYHILPYAQVLNVTDKWEEKFASITMEPPHWLTGNALHTYTGIHVLSHTMRVSSMHMARTMVSRPSSSGMSGGGGHGGSFGGFGGGGHGGGGGRGR